MQLVAIQEAVTLRREEQNVRQARQTAIAEEERANVRLVEEFIRQEEEREAAAAEARRREEEAERLAAEERRRQEALAHLEEELAIIASLGVKYQLLAGELETLHEYQRGLIQERHDFESETHTKSLADALSTLALQHSQDLESLYISSRERISQIEASFDTEYQTRVAEERRIEDEYVDELRVYWKERSGGEYRIRASIDELRREQGREFQFWDSYRQTKILACEEGEKKRKEFMEARQGSERREVEGRSEIDRIEGSRKWEAERKWFDTVVQERATMLQDLEREEVGVAVVF